MTKTEAVLRLMSIPLLEWDGKEEVEVCGGKEAALALTFRWMCVSHPAFFRCGARVTLRLP
jgi:hypothetical protein